MIAGAPLLLLPLLAPQDPPAQEAPPPAAETLLDRYLRLDRDRRNTVVRNIERRLLRVNDDVLQRIAGFERGLASYEARGEPTFFRTADYAPVATTRRLIRAGSAAHGKATAGMAPLLFLPDLQACVVYDWGAGKAVRVADGLDDDRRFQNYVRGYPPGADHAVARILAALDHDPGQRKLASYFGHLYADRNGGVYEDVTLFDAWHSGTVVEVPDTDAIAYAREILLTRSFTSPIPPDRRRERLYRKIRAGFGDHREYRSLRLAAAAAFVVATPRFEPTYEPLVRRCRWLWMQCDYDVERFGKRLAETGDRAEFLAAIDRAIASSPEVVDGERDVMQARADFLRTLADRELTAQGG